MAVRAGMAFLVSQLRAFTEAGTDYSDDDLQNLLDNLFTDYYKYVLLTPDITRLAPYIVVYVDYYLPDDIGSWFEVPVDGVTKESFYVQDYLFNPIIFGNGADQIAYNDGLKRLTLGTNRFGQHIFWSGYSFDLYGAAAYIWSQKYSNASMLISIKTDNHTLDFSTERDRYKERYNYFSSLSNKKSRFIREDQGAGQTRNPMNLGREVRYGN